MDKCADCGGSQIIGNAEGCVIDGKPFLVRAGYCNECGWNYEYTSALRTFTDSQRSQGIGPPLPDDPFGDTVLMLAPDADAKATS